MDWYRSHSGHSLVLWIAQSEELCEQAVQSFREVWIDLGHRKNPARETLGIARCWGTSPVPDPEENGVVVASIQKLQAVIRDPNSEANEELALLRDHLGVVVIDEAHRASASSYREVLRFLGIDTISGANSEIPLLGLTATPFRSDETETPHLFRIFHHRLLESSALGDEPFRTLREREVLSTAEHEFLQHSAHTFDMDRDQRFVQYFDQFNDFHPAFLREIGGSEQRNQALLNRIRQVPETSPTLFFGSTVEHAQAMAVLLRRSGRAAEVITGETRSATRRAIIEEFRDGGISVLCNYGVLTTGFDAPRVETLVIGRPTASRVLYAQMIGRGMRGSRFGGTPSCRVIDVWDNIRFRGELVYNKYESYFR